MSQVSPGAVVSSAYWDTERELWQFEKSLVQGELVICNLEDSDSGEADLSQPFDIRWQTFSPNEDIFGEEVTARVTMENGELKSQIIELHPLLKSPELLRELQDNPKIGQHKLMIKKANHDSELVTCHCL
ncbi:hypothetical protein BDV24DRAFT_156320 [Aspergillus arachidicola]|uniref:Uncharacterized protein n=1 Tax=Aspergillus arachidicola TaxID=656916 RepID=A0A5N6XPC9_9EURO|nr:hypothetical protein BDV24DRAFT_156320 [Aspergillus arachidicola]